MMSFLLGSVPHKHVPLHLSKGKTAGPASWILHIRGHIVVSIIFRLNVQPLYTHEHLSHHSRNDGNWDKMMAVIVFPLTLASMTSPMSWTMGVSLRFFIASHRLAAKKRQRSNIKSEEQLTNYLLLWQLYHTVYFHVVIKAQNTYWLSKPAGWDCLLLLWRLLLFT